MPARTRTSDWSRLPDEELLDLRFCDLKLKIEGGWLEERIQTLYTELARRNLRLRPHCWLSEEWFSPDGVPGIALPFYLAHPRLMKLEDKQMFDIEGGTERWCLQLLRHETGHAIDTAFRLRRRKDWRNTFGPASKPYPNSYKPKPTSKHYVLHLDWWYAQSHPCEDFAETFAVWLQPRSRWRKRYESWPALKKLEYVDELMGELAGQKAPVTSRERPDSLAGNRTTLREHYAKKREHYEINTPELYDRDLRRLFGDYSHHWNTTPARVGVPRKPRGGPGRTASAILKSNRSQLCRVCSRGTGEHPYAIDQMLQEMVLRCRELGLRNYRDEEQVKLDLAIFLSVQTVNYLHKGHHRIPM